MAKLSVIVPIYNVEAYLPQCVDSILAQTFTDFELILVDDGSPDRCPKLCDTYAAKDPRITVIHKENAGVSAARNTGLDHATGEFVTFVDGDDYLQPRWFEHLVTHQQESGADSVIGRCTDVYEETGTCVESAIPARSVTLSLANDNERVDYIFDYIFSSECHIWSVWARLFLRSRIEEHHLRFPTTCENFAEDMGFVLAYSLYAHRVTVAREYPGYCYVHRGGSMMDTSKQVIKLNQLNEVSFWLGHIFFDTVDASLRDTYFALHFLMMNSQYVGILQSGSLKQLRRYTDTIVKQDWYREQNRSVFKTFCTLRRHYGRKAAVRHAHLALYVKTHSWFLYRLTLPLVRMLG